MDRATFKKSQSQTDYLKRGAEQYPVAAKFCSRIHSFKLAMRRLQENVYAPLVGRPSVGEAKSRPQEDLLIFGVAHTKAQRGREVPKYQGSI